MPSCEHAVDLKPVKAKTRGCEECLQHGWKWVHLRVCIPCGHVGCCDDSEHQHGTKHFHATHHPVMRSYEPHEAWGWCFVDEIMLPPEELPHVTRA